MTRLYVICGHGAGDPGACGNGYSEAERVRALGRELAAAGGDSVVLLDTSRDWYADAGINGLDTGGEPLVELHMDGSVSSSACGGHVIICDRFEADDWDRALASWVGSYFPGRSSTLVKRGDLANPNRAANRGINYRLLECGFVTNPGDVTKLSNNIREVAEGILGCFGIGSEGGASPSPSPSPAPSGKTVEQLADEVIAGAWGNGCNRQQALEGAGYDYYAVQTRVNEKLGVGGGASVDIEALAQAVIRGDYGNGEERRAALGANYDAVQARVNEILC